MNDVNVAAYPYLDALTGEEKASFRALGPAAAARVVLAAKRVVDRLGLEGAIDAVRAQLGPLVRGEAAPPLPPDPGAADLPASDPASPGFAAWCASQSPLPAQCDPYSFPLSDPRNPKFPAWCASQNPRPLDCPAPASRPPTGTEYPLSDPRNPGHAAYCTSTTPPPAGCTTELVVRRDESVPAARPPAQEEGLIARVMRDPPWPLFVVAGAFVGWWAAGMMKPAAKPAAKRDDGDDEA